MEWQMQEMHMQQEEEEEEEEYAQYQMLENGVFGKVMTDEQVEELRKQIVAYQEISLQLSEMHKAISAHQDFTGGIRFGTSFYEPILTTFGHKMTARQRWTPSPLQLQILESIYGKGNGTPSKQKIKDITAQLAQHGQISETNVYNWFQNRRARSKRKIQTSGSGNADAEGGAESSATKERRTKPQNLESGENSAKRVQNFYFQNSDTGIGNLSGKVGSARGYEPYNDLVEEFGLLG